MNWLLDTHVWVWSQLEPERLGTTTQKILLDKKQTLHISTVSTLEVARLVEGGRVCLGMTMQDWVEISGSLLDLRTTELSHAHAIESYALPSPFHRDPADRMLVATARTEKYTLVTADQRILDYDHVSTHDARL